MNNFINDIIHSTKVEFFLKYWYLYLIFIAIAIILTIKEYKDKAKQINDKYDKLEKEILK